MSFCIAFTACGSSTKTEQSSEVSKTVSVLGVVVGEQQDKLEAALAPFEEKTGIDVLYEGTDAFATLLPVRVESGDAPDIAMFAQPGLMRDFAKSGQLVSISEFIDQNNLKESYTEDWLKLATVDEKMYGVWYRASVKSLVWYNPEAFAAKGYQVPQTWSEMIALSDRIVQEGGTPWCLGMESGDATGWVGTDWVEDIMLRTAGPKVYDQWVNHEIPYQQVSLDVYPDEVTRKQAEILTNAEVVRFDGSDMMPSSVGTGTFWTGIVDYVGGGDDVEKVLTRIEESWSNK